MPHPSAGFNVLIGDLSTAYCVSNSSARISPASKTNGSNCKPLFSQSVIAFLITVCYYAYWSGFYLLSTLIAGPVMPEMAKAVARKGHDQQQ